MKREEVKAKIPGITDEQLDWIMGENGKEINAEKNKASSLQSQVEELTTQLNTAKDGLKAFEGVDVNELKSKNAELQKQLADQENAFAFDRALDSAIRERKGRDVAAIRGMLDIEKLKASKDRTSDIKAALDGLYKEKGWAFETEGSGMQVSTGGEHGSGGNSADGVEAAFAALNPGLKL